MAGFLWLALALILLGLFYYSKKNNLAVTKNEVWPSPEWSKERARDKLMLSDPWETALWLTTSFRTNEELWEELKAGIEESGLEGVYLAGLTSGEEDKLLAIKALGLIGGVSSLPILVKTLSSPSDELSLEAVQALKQVGLKESGELLVNALIGGKGAVPTRAADILIDLGALVKGSILEALASVPDSYKPILIEILGEIKEEDKLYLTPYLASEQSTIRLKAVQAIGLAGNRNACPHLLPLLGDEDWRVRSQVARFLGRLGCLDAILDLKKLCYDSVWHVQVNAKEALEELGVALEQEE